MANFLRKVVSGPKARHVDKDLNVDLDLSYITDRLIIMGWPASKFEALYRNPRKDVRRFLDAKHGEKYRVYNLCPCGENSYDASEFYGAVSRYPFPDHHPPPLSLIPMFVCDITAWLAADPENVAVIHCKAGKGRSGTMACCYMLSLPLLPKLTNGDERGREESNATNTTVSSNAASPYGSPLKGDTQAVMLGNLLSDHPDVRSAAGPSATSKQVASAAMEAAGSSESAYSVDALTARLDAVFELHTARRLKPSKQRKKSFHALQDSQQIDRTDQIVSPDKDQTIHRSRSVAAILRKASQGFRSTSNSPANQSTSSRRSSSAVSTPSRSMLQSTTSPPSEKASALGVSPKGRSTTDLRTIHHHDRRAASTSGLNGSAWLTPLQSPMMVRIENHDPDAELSCLDRYVIAAGSPDAKRGSKVNTLPSESPLSLRPPPLSIEQGSPSSASKMRMFSSSPYPLGSSAQSSNLSFFASEAPSNAITDDERTPSRTDLAEAIEASGLKEEHPVKFAVSIPSQRRFVGYWARMLAGRDARSEPLFNTVEPVRRVRITRIRIDRQVPEQEEPLSGDADKKKAKEDKTAFSVQMCQYNPLMEYKLHQWETSARRRTRAFGFVDPSAPAPELPADKLDEHGSDFKGPQRRRMEREAETKRWQSVEAQNAEGAYERKMSQHGNDCGVGCWGINVLAEQDRIRHFDWSEPRSDRTSSRDLKVEMKLQHLAYVYETSQIHKHASSTTQGTAPGDESAVKTGVMQHIFSMEKDNLANVRFEEGRTTPSWIKKRLPAARKSDQQQEKGREDEHDSHAIIAESDDSSPSESVELRTSRHETDKRSHSTPPTSVESMTRDSDDDDEDLECGIVVNADHAVMIKILAGRTGTTHNLLPDMASCGYIWFVPSFESPSDKGKVTSGKGDRVRCTFTAKEIDFRKAKKMAKLTGGEIVGVEVEWQWLDAVQSADNESVQELLL